ncbi:MAG: DUF4369 domain-containing protein [Flavobacteriaceae bacterium]
MTLQKISFFLFVGLLLWSCQPNSKPLDSTKMNVIGRVEGLRKGTLYLQKVEDTLLVTVDSTVIAGNPQFQFSTALESPEVFYLYLNKEDGDSLNDRIPFFGEKGTIEINTLLKTFESSAQIKGSKNQELLQNFLRLKRQFNDKNLSLLEAYFKAQQRNNQKQIDSLQTAIDNLLKRRYLYTLNFAAQNANQNVAPYLLLTEVYDANLTLLDSVAVKMSSSVRNSKYGQELLTYIAKRKETN